MSNGSSNSAGSIIFKAHYTFNFLFITVFMKEKELTEYIVWDNGIMKLFENDREQNKNDKINVNK